MEWKQPERVRRHWVLEEFDGELLFPAVPADAAQGRLGDTVFELRDGGLLRKKRTLAAEGAVLATMEESAGGTGGTLSAGGREYRWRPASLMGNRWVLEDADRRTVFTIVLKQGLGKIAKVEIAGQAQENIGQLLLLCWYVTVL